MNHMSPNGRKSLEIGADVVPDKALDRTLQAKVVGTVKEENRLTLLVVSQVRFIREALADLLHRDPLLAVLAVSANFNEAVAESQSRQPDAVLVDANSCGGPTIVRQLRQAFPELCIVVLAVTETAENIIAWAEAGATGYVPQTTALADLVSILINIREGNQVCAARTASGLLRHIARTARAEAAGALPEPATTLTRREREISLLICAGLSNKEIARRLDIGVATAKSHVHNLLGKMNVQHRGQAAARLGSSRGSMWGSG